MAAIVENPLQSISFWSYAFRPFFLLNGLFAVLAMAVWVLALHGVGLPANVGWHAHEMLIGFAMAAVAGFVLTAVATWTGRQPVAGAALGLLVTAWLAGRVAMAFAHELPGGVVAVADMAFPLLLCALIGREVLAAGNRRNFPIVGLVALLVLINAGFHLGHELTSAYLAIHVILLLITVIAGRIIPSFTANWLRARGAEQMPANATMLNIVTIVATAATGIGAVVAPTSPVTGVSAVIAAVAHGLRLAGWRGLATTGEPLLFVLHVAYLWLPVGYALTALAVFGSMFPNTAALHALTMGAIGSMILAVTTRVALGHTGRRLHAARLTVVAYGALTAAVFVRIAASFAGDAYLGMVDIAALGWMAAFALFSWVYWPVLTGPRVD